MAARSRSEKRLEAAYNESQGRSLVQRKHTILRLGRYMIQYKWQFAGFGGAHAFGLCH